MSRARRRCVRAMRLPLGIGYSPSGACPGDRSALGIRERILWCFPGANWSARAILLCCDMSRVASRMVPRSHLQRGCRLRRFGLVGALLALLVGLVIVALPAASALAFTTTIGQTGSDPALLCPGSSAFADTNYAVSSSGGIETITSFSFQSDSSNRGEQIAFLVLRPAEGNSYTVVANTGLVTLRGSGPEPETFAPARPISVQRGDILGFWLPAQLDNCGRDVNGSGGALDNPNSPEP